MAKPKTVLVLSGKGGVGKTLIAVNLALHLSDKGVKVGLLDADFSASNTGYFLKLDGQYMLMSKEEFCPIDYNGIEVFSIPLLLGEKSVSMTGDQYSQLLRDAIEAAAWKAEYMIVDCPAGFGDELKTAAKIFSDSLLGSIIVIQPAHELDGHRALQLHKDLELPVLGLIENMSSFKAGVVTYKIFGDSVVEKLGETYGVQVFGKIPLSMEVRRQIEAKNPKLTGEYGAPIENAVKAIMEAKPQKPGFLERLKSLIKEQLEKLIIELTVSINTEINIPDIQKRFGYPGGSIIRLNIMNENMDKILTQTDWMVDTGKLIGVDGKYNVDAQIDITPKAVKWTMLKDKVLSNGMPYTFQDALRLGHMRVYGGKSMARASFFIQNVFTELSNNENAIKKLRPLLEVL